MKYDVVIVGAGPAGLFSAYELITKNKKLKVALLDRGNDVKTSLICLIVGILLLLSARGIIDFAIVGRLIFPIILIIFGLMLILKRNKTNEFAKIEMDKDGISFSDAIKTLRLNRAKALKRLKNAGHPVKSDNPIIVTRNADKTLFLFIPIFYI